MLELKMMVMASVGPQVCIRIYDILPISFCTEYIHMTNTHTKKILLILPHARHWIVKTRIHYNAEDLTLLVGADRGGPRKVCALVLTV